MKKVISIIVTIMFLILTSTISYASTNVILNSTAKEVYAEEHSCIYIKIE